MGKIKGLILVIILITMTGCGVRLWGDWPSETADIGSKDFPHVYGIKWKIKRYDYNYEPWPYVSEVRCGWFYDEWMNEIDADSDEVCSWQCIEMDRFNQREWFYPTLERCLYQDYKGGVETIKGYAQ